MLYIIKRKDHRMLCGKGSYKSDQLPLEAKNYERNSTVKVLFFVVTNSRGFEIKHMFMDSFPILLYKSMLEIPFVWYRNLWIGQQTKSMKIGFPRKIVFFKVHNIYKAPI